MRPSSSTSDPPLGLFDGVLARGGARTATADAAWVAAMLRVEATLAEVAAEVGVVPAEAARAIGHACDTLHPDVAALAAGAAASGNPVVPLVAQLRSAVPSDAAEYVHKGATSQDVLDSAAMLVAGAAVDHLLDDARGAADAAAALAREHRDTPMAARTLLRQAVPTTFGLKAAGWALALDEAVARLAAVRASRLAVQFGGPAGTLAGLDGLGPEIASRLARRLGLADPVLPWHTNRVRLAELAGALGALAGVCAKVAGDLALLAQDEVAEVAEGSPGGSSSMAHKRNPVAAVSAVGCAMRAPGLVADILAAMGHEHERAAGAWHAEWLPLRDLLVATGSALAWLREGLSQLSVDPIRMLSNMDGLIAVVGEVDLGSCGELVDRALAEHERSAATSRPATGAAVGRPGTGTTTARPGTGTTTPRPGTGTTTPRPGAGAP